MMDILFQEWVEKNKNIFDSVNIKVSRIQKSDNGDENHAITITHESKLFIGQITVRRTGYIDIEILKIDSGEMIFHLYCMAKKEVDFDSLFQNYIEYMKNIE